MGFQNLLGIPQRGWRGKYATLHTPNGNGSVGTCVVTYAKKDDAGGINAIHDPVNGDYIQITEDGLYVIFRQIKTSNAGNFHGITVNIIDATEAVETAAGGAHAKSVLSMIEAPAVFAHQPLCLMTIAPLYVGDKICAHDEAAGEEEGASTFQRLTVARIS